MTMDRTCGESLPYLLANYGVTTVFGMPGVHSLEPYRTIGAAGLDHVGVRHEQGAGFMADGYARASGRPGVCLLISGPGVTNAATPLGQAYSDSVPLLALTTVNARGDIGLGRGMLHEISDQAALTTPITGMSAVTWDAAQLPVVLGQAMALFRAARPRPAHISIPLDVLELPAEGSIEPVTLPDRPAPSRRAIERAAALVRDADRPVLLIGGGAVEAGAELRRLAERTGAAVVTTIAGKGVVPESHPQSLGSTLQRIATRRFIAEADLVIAVGTEIAEPDLYVSADAEAAGGPGEEVSTLGLEMSGRLVRVDLDPSVVVRDYPPDVALIGDAAETAEMLVAALGQDRVASCEGWDERLKAVRAANVGDLSALEAKHLAVLDMIRRALPETGQVYADMSQISYTGCIHFPVERARSWHFPVGYGTLGYALPAAIGGAIACPDRATLALVGDGGLLFTVQELATAVERRLPLPILLWDNGALGEIADFMRSRQIPQVGVYPHNPDFLALARSFGCNAVEPESLEDIGSAIEAALGADAPTLIRVRQDATYL